MPIIYCGYCLKVSLGESSKKCSRCGSNEITELNDKEVMDEINKLKTGLCNMMAENLKLTRMLNNAKHKAEQVSKWLEVEIVNEIFDECE